MKKPWNCAFSISKHYQADAVTEVDFLIEMAANYQKYSHVFQLVVDRSLLPFERKGPSFCIKNGSSNIGS